MKHSPLQHNPDAREFASQHVADEYEPIDLPATFADWLTGPVVPAGTTTVAEDEAFYAEAEVDR